MTLSRIARDQTNIFINFYEGAGFIELNGQNGIESDKFNCWKKLIDHYYDNEVRRNKLPAGIRPSDLC
jgi:hypothetical protein